jgi:hypothetical protein
MAGERLRPPEEGGWRPQVKSIGRQRIPPASVLFQLKSGRTSAPRLPQAWQTNRGSISDSLNSSGCQWSALSGCSGNLAISQTATAPLLPSRLLGAC